MSNEIVPSEDPLALLSPREQREYQIYMRLRQPPMAVSTALQFFQLFLNGSSCEDIVRLNPNGFSLGAIVRARLENNWDQYLAEHKIELMAKIRDRVQQVTFETVDRLTLEMAASNKLTTDAVKKYLQTGDVAELKNTGVGSIRHLKDAIEMLQKLTGQDQPKRPNSMPEPQAPRVTTVEATVLPAVPLAKPLPPQTAASALEIIHKSRQPK